MLIDELDKEKLLALYPGYSKAYIGINREGRRVVFLYKYNKVRSSLSYARALMQVCLGRLLLKGEEVDHKDKIKTNDTLDNFEIVTGLENRHRTRTLTNKVCICGKEFRPKRRKQQFCCRSCSDLYRSRGKRHSI